MQTIAVTGKGGTGKTTITAMTVHWLRKNTPGSILAVDADSNVNLNELLGVQVRETVGSIREEMKSRANNLPSGMTKQQFMEYKIQTSLVETADFDLVAMGRPEGPGCYCYANSLLRDILRSLSGNYDYVVIDNEAGMEHLSRKTTQNIDCMFIVSDSSVRGVRAAGRIAKVVDELETRVEEKHLILNRTCNSIPQTIEEAVESEGLTLLCEIPEDDNLSEMDRAGKPFWPSFSDMSAYVAWDRAMQELGIANLN